MRPKPRDAIAGASRRASMNGAVRFTATCASQSSSVTSSIRWRIRPTPAFATSTSTGPSSFSTSSTSCSVASRSLRSAPAVSPRAPPAASSRASSSARAASCAYASATAAPAPASRRDSAAPMPPLAPVTSATRPARPPSLATDLQRVNDEDERGVRGDRRRLPLRAVGELGRDGQLAATARLDADEPLVPALDHHALAEREVEWLAVVPRGVELLAGVVEDADVLHRELVALLGGLALAHDDVLRHELGRRLARLLRDLRLRLRVLQVRRGLRRGHGLRRRAGAGGDVGGGGAVVAAAAGKRD